MLSEEYFSALVMHGRRIDIINFGGDIRKFVHDFVQMAFLQVERRKFKNGRNFERFLGENKEMKIADKHLAVHR